MAGLFAGVLAGGVFKETLLRLFLVSLLVWIFQRVFGRKSEQMPDRYYWITIAIASLVFAAAHLPFTSLVFGDLTAMILVRCFLLNGIGGLFFGYLYWKKGFEYAVLSHIFAHISLQLLFIPLFY
ncbi:CPBP family intramembrane metalloprotease [Bacillus sp. PAMC26568]|nr:CPBP family intramembrane metalloprotease [Bacillus sp. PAMC26568]